MSSRGDLDPAGRGLARPLIVMADGVDGPQAATIQWGPGDVDVVVTEHGVADLRGLDQARRTDRLIAVAAPEHRARLAAESRCR